MGVDDGSVATTALIIAIAAFITAFGQLLQQLFVTADGLRRCQNSVIGGWSQLVQLRFRWSSLRFEVRVVTPHFVIGSPKALTTSIRKFDKPPTRFQRLLMKPSNFWCDASEPVAMIGTTESFAWTSLRTIEGASTEEPVMWLSLIEDIHELQTRGPTFREYANQLYAERAALLSFTRLTRSWDFMPVEIVRPFASTTIGCLVSTIHRLNFTWIKFDLDEGIVHATGRGRGISTSRIRGLGIVVEYVRNGASLHTDLYKGSNPRIEVEDVDKMACGILPSCSLITDTMDLPLRDQSKPLEVQLSPAFRALGLNDVTVEALHQSIAHRTTTQALPGFADLLGLWTEWLPSPTMYTVIESPFPVEVEPMGRRPEPRVVWRYLLQQNCSDSTRFQRIMAIYDEWESFDPVKFQTLFENHPTDDFGYCQKMSSFSKAVFDETGLYFARYGAWFYSHLVKAHVTVNAQSFMQAEENIRAGLSRPHPPISLASNHYQGDTVFTERAFVYVDNISKFVSEVNVGWPTSDEIEEAWWMMMLRMQVWNWNVKLTMREGLTVPHQYYGDPTRIYIL